MKRRIGLIMMLSLCLCACGQTAAPADDKVETIEEQTMESSEEVVETTEEASIEEPATEAPQEDTINGMPVKRYNFLLERSVLDAGNNARIKAVIEKARSGEEVKVVALGGSITEGTGAPSKQGYAYQFVDAFAQAYGNGDNIRYFIAGLSGTPSTIGVMRYDKDVVNELGGAPDLLIVEFAVNDYQEITGGRAFEGLIYRALSDNPDCAVIVLCSVAKSKWNNQTDMAATAKYYGVPVVSMKRCLDSSGIPDSTYFRDDYHPTLFGHTLTKDCLMYLLEQADAAEADEALEMPKDAHKDRSFANMQLVDENTEGVTISLGSFSQVDKVGQKNGFTEKIAFPQNFSHDTEGGTEGLSFTMKCSKVLLNYKAAGDKSYGDVDVYVDGKKVTTLSGYVAGGWNNCTAALVLDESKVKKHTIELRMAEGSESAKFTLYGIAFDRE